MRAFTNHTHEPSRGGYSGRENKHMCCCNEPNINGQEGYSWNGKDSGIRKPYLPELDEGDVLLRDLPGRCGAIDSHCHDLRLVRSGSFPMLLVGNGAGRHRIRLSADKGLSGSQRRGEVGL